MLGQGNAALNESAQNLERGAEQLKQALPSSDARERMYYDAAWAYRTLADSEVVAARHRMQQDRQRALQADADRKAAPGTKAPQVPLPEISRHEIPVQGYEQRTRAAYEHLIANFNDTLLSIDAPP